MTQVFIIADAFSADAALEAFAASRPDNAGACASFVGYCRASSRQGPVRALELQHYPGFTETQVERLAAAVAERHQLIDLLIIHRVGVIAAREAIVLVAAMSAHRNAAFAAASEMMDYLKTDAPFWKREIGPDGSRWIEPSASDYARRAEHAND